MRTLRAIAYHCCGIFSAFLLVSAELSGPSSQANSHHDVGKRQVADTGSTFQTITTKISIYFATATTFATDDEGDLITKTTTFVKFNVCFIGHIRGVISCFFSAFPFRSNSNGSKYLGGSLGSYFVTLKPTHHPHRRFTTTNRYR
ncbi:hypothetical protein GTA08_BOTSDO02517 [Botryosphaeria dothidea]|uniref:Secreted protein n=1 Tax=Botryosphaeria dothidea TaxID=55169 RepID=A0A8H4IXS4_9PEZI|nr:hypothetical protein GTA08_BOTSDO02517 [Botryosphaeria dothidea]